MFLCALCHETKPADAFSLSSANKNGRQGYCKDCRKLKKTLGSQPRLSTLREAFYRVMRPGEASACWEWPGTRDKDGYGHLMFRKKRYKTHRIAAMLTYGTLSGDKVVCHTCDNPPCCNPSHLFLGNRGMNNRDMREKGRASKGEERWNAKLTAWDVVRIRTLSMQMTQQALANMFGVSQRAICDIIHRKHWQHVP